jgi:excisionase family DNA binding protein
MKEIETLFGLMRQLIDEVRTLRRAPGNSGPTEIDANRPLSREEAADYLGVHKDTLYRWAVEEGRIAYSRLGNGGRAPLRFSRKDLDHFISSQRIPTVQELRNRR